MELSPKLTHAGVYPLTDEDLPSVSKPLDEDQLADLLIEKSFGQMRAMACGMADMGRGLDLDFVKSTVDSELTRLLPQSSVHYDPGKIYNALGARLGPISAERD